MNKRKWSVSQYSDAWQAGTIQAAIRDYANHRCEHCDMLFHYGTNKAVSATNADGRACIGTVHHLDGNKQNYAWENLLFCCQRCHLEIQATWIPGGVLPLKWGSVPEWLTKRGLSYQVNPQLVLL